MPTVIINYEYEPGETVYLITDEDQARRMVLSISYDGSSELMYTLIKGTVTSTHYTKEISREQTFVK